MAKLSDLEDPQKFMELRVRIGRRLRGMTKGKKRRINTRGDGMFGSSSRLKSAK